MDTLFPADPKPHRMDDEILDRVEAAIMSKYEVPMTIRTLRQKVFWDTGVRYHPSTLLRRVQRLVELDKVYAVKGLVTNPHNGRSSRKAMVQGIPRKASMKLLVYGPWTTRYKERNASA